MSISVILVGIWCLMAVFVAREFMRAPLWDMDDDSADAWLHEAPAVIRLGQQTRTLAAQAGMPDADTPPVGLASPVDANLAHAAE
jgi:hypothetical protein